jgi:hypothetical protein
MIEKVKTFPFIRNWFGSSEKREKHILQMAETRTPCSCWMCGNPRKYLKQKSIKEKVSILNQKEELDEYL